MLLFTDEVNVFKLPVLVSINPNLVFVLELNVFKLLVLVSIAVNLPPALLVNVFNELNRYKAKKMIRIRHPKELEEAIKF